GTMQRWLALAKQTIESLPVSPSRTPSPPLSSSSSSPGTSSSPPQPSTPTLTSVDSLTANLQDYNPDELGASIISLTEQLERARAKLTANKQAVITLNAELEQARQSPYDQTLEED